MNFYDIRILFNSYVLVCLVAILLSSCANIVSPSGGPKDEDPPQITSSVPANYSVHFNKQKIILYFDEYINLTNPSNNIIISPPLNNKPIFKIKKKSVVISLNDDTLKTNATYTINFGEAISDLNEGNRLTNYQYVFSTGSYVDSLSIKGVVQFAKDTKTEKDILVMLYPEISDTVVFSKRPYYFTKTLPDGSFKLPNLKQWDYKLFALKDQNYNYLYDLPNEEIAFSDTTISITDDTSRVLYLNMFKEDNEAQSLTDAYSKRYGRIYLTFKRPADSISLHPQNLDTANYFTLIEHISPDTMRYWIDDPHLDTLIFFIDNNTVTIDTAIVSIPAIPADSSLQLKLRIFHPFSTNGNNRFGLFDPLLLSFHHPISNFDPKNITLLEDTFLTKVIADFELLGTGNRKLSVSYPWKKLTPYKVIITDSAITDIFGLTNDSLILDFVTKSPEEYSNLKVKVVLPNTDIPYFIQLLNKYDKVLEQYPLKAVEEQSIDFNFLDPSTYYVRITEDINANDKWDIGHYLKGVQPENVYYYPERIVLRANWDIEVDFSISDY